MPDHCLGHHPGHSFAQNLGVIFLRSENEKSSQQPAREAGLAGDGFCPLSWRAPVMQGVSFPDFTDFSADAFYEPGSISLSCQIIWTDPYLSHLSARLHTLPLYTSFEMASLHNI